MLAGDFFLIVQKDATEGNIGAVLEIDPEHAIFEGHFPAQPIVPGVCMMQMIKEIVEQHLGKSTLLKKADQLKFLTVINPVYNNMIHADIKYKEENGIISLNASLLNDDVVYFKMKAELQVVRT